MSTKTVIYFTADTKPTVAELAAIARLNALAESAYNVQVRNGGATAKMSSIEPCDYVAGTVPTAYAGEDLLGGDGKIDADRPLAFAVFPPTLAISSGTAQARAIACTGTNADDSELKDVTADTLWTSSDTGKATVGAYTGIITKVAAGTTTVTATYTYTSGKTLTDTCAVTVS